MDAYKSRDQVTLGKSLSFQYHYIYLISQIPY